MILLVVCGVLFCSAHVRSSLIHGTHPVFIRPCVAAKRKDLRIHAFNLVDMRDDSSLRPG